MDQQQQKKRVAKAVLDYIEPGSIVGIGSGSTVNCFIEELAGIKHRIEGTVASSKATEDRLRGHNIPVLDLNVVDAVPVYIDGADEANRFLQLIKGGGGALTREKIIAAAAQQFVCIIDESKQVDALGHFPLPIEVIAMARSYVAREIVRLGGNPSYRQNFVTDNGHIILDIHHLEIKQPVQLEQQLNNITGVVSNGLFAMRPADVLLVAQGETIQTINR